MLTAYLQDLDDIPGTTVFTPKRARQGLYLNQFCMSLLKPENRDAFRADEEAYLDGWALSDAQRKAVRDRDYNAMIALGGNFYFLYKIGATDGFSVQKVVGQMTGMTAEEYGAMMLAGGRSPEGQRSKRANAAAAAA
ncbi:MAG: protocatechuate 3,4-dioxygenase [Sphingomonas bacterium]|nr:protocatechuate 3,4-dioxygenase [Sphingomonas bacterium]MDB5717612.1 protocatechuate 3,4-dioxygenase [Sphingomonas bacterium]